MLTSWIRGLFRKSTRAARRSHSSAKAIGSIRFRPRFDSLEAREVPAFLTPVSYSTGANPAGIAVGDFNGDGRSDMAVVSNTLAGSVGVLMSNVDGTFAPRVDYPAGANSFDASAGDFNGDGKIDLAVVGTDVNVLLGNGDGTFGAPVAYAAVAGSHSIKVGDFNNDGKLDVGTVAGSFAGGGNASVFLGNGDGTLQPRLDSAMPGNNINLVVGDYNHDGFLDMASSNTASVGTINVLRGHGDGTFDPVLSYYAFSAPVYLGQGDFNHDGYLDFVVPNSYSATSMSVVMNNGDGTYASPHTYGISATGYEIEVADFNNDGNDDFAVRSSSMYMVSLGKGDGTFYPSVNYATPTGRFEAGTHGDFNGDGAVDLVYPTTTGVTVVTNDNADLQNLAGAVTFQVSAPATTTSGSVLPMTVNVVDANGNVASGFRGVVFLSSSDPAATTAAGYAFNPADAGIPYVFTAADAGTHSFTGAIRLVTGGVQTVKLSAPNMTAASASVLVTGQITHLTFTAPSASNAGDTFNVTLSALDTQGLAAAGYSSRIHFTSSDAMAGLPADSTFMPQDAGVHTFTVTLKTAGAKTIGAIEVGGTINGGATVTVAPLAATSLSLAVGSGAIGITRPLTIAARDIYGNFATGYTGTVHFTSSDPLAVLPADVALVNGAATVNVKFLTLGTQTITATDVVTASIAGTVSSNATPPVASVFVVAGIPATTAGVVNSFTVTVRDTIGQIATGYAGSIYFSSSDVQAGLPASYTFTAADAGVHSFTATFRTAGIQSLTARDASGALTGTESGIAVNAAAFSRLVLSVPNGKDSKGHMLVTAGETISLTVRALDSFGNTISGYKGKVKFTSTDVQASVPTDYTFTVADAGVHTFSMVLKTSNPNGVVWSFSVVDASNAASLATITNFEVNNAVAAKFVFAVSSNATAGTPFTVKVTVLDAFGNTVKNYFGKLHFGSSADSLGLPADYSFNSTDAGVHTFSVTLTTSGNVTLSIFDVVNSSLTASGVVSVKAAGGGGGGSGGGGSGKP